MSEEKLDISELSEEKLLALEKLVQIEITNRNSPGLDLTELSDTELQNLADRIEEQKAKGTVVNFHHAAISHHNCSQVLKKLKEQDISLIHRPRPLTIRLAENYLEDKEVEGVCEYILQSKTLKHNLVRLELNHNRLQKGVLPCLKKIVEQCVNLRTLDFSINYIGQEEFEKVFGKMSAGLRQKVKFSAY